MFHMLWNIQINVCSCDELVIRWRTPCYFSALYYWYVAMSLHSIYSICFHMQKIWCWPRGTKGLLTNNRNGRKHLCVAMQLLSAVSWHGVWAKRNFQLSKALPIVSAYMKCFRNLCERFDTFYEQLEVDVPPSKWCWRMLEMLTSTFDLWECLVSVIFEQIGIIMALTLNNACSYVLNHILLAHVNTFDWVVLYYLQDFRKKF